jgi:CheY-like chemotaxis protein
MALRARRSYGTRLGLPVVFVTARGEPVTRRRAAIVEPVAYLEKPVPARHLIKAVEQAAAMKRGPVANP